MSKYTDLMYGSEEHRSNRRKHVNLHRDNDVAELGKMAVQGVVTVGVIGVTGAVVGGLIGGLPKQP